MKIILELTGREYRLIQEAIGALLDDAKKVRSEIDRKEHPIRYDEANFKVHKIAELYSSL